MSLASCSLELEFPFLFSLEHLELANRDLATYQSALKGDRVKQFKNELIDSAIIRRSSYGGIDGNPFTDLILTRVLSMRSLMCFIVWNSPLGFGYM